jgi:glycosyltransferase involved in cell wall biosynthesis
MTAISVVIPAFNSTTSIRRSLDSVLDQSRSANEVIVVDDGSTDDTASKVQEYAPNVQYVAQANQGQAVARNHGLKLASGEFVAFLDADDYWLPGFLQTTTRFLNSNPDAIAVSVGSRVKKWGKSDALIPTFLNENSVEQPARILDDFFSFWAQHDHVRTGSVLIRKRAIDEAGGQLADLRMSQDLEYWGYLATFGKWGFIPEVHFVTDATPNAAANGWVSKYKKRRKMCPTVDAWQRRILPRVTDSQIGSFLDVRGRVAAGFAHAMVLAGRSDDAHKTVIDFGQEFPNNWSANLMRRATRFGPLGWRCACAVIHARERSKAMMIGLSAVKQPQDPTSRDNLTDLPV